MVLRFPDYVDWSREKSVLYTESITENEYYQNLKNPAADPKQASAIVQGFMSDSRKKIGSAQSYSVRINLKYTFHSFKKFTVSYTDPV